MRFRKEAMPVPVPLFGAGKTSGVLDGCVRRFVCIWVGCGEGRDLLCVQDAVHDVLEESFETRHGGLIV